MEQFQETYQLPGPHQGQPVLLAANKVTLS